MGVSRVTVLLKARLPLGLALEQIWKQSALYSSL